MNHTILRVFVVLAFAFVAVPTAFACEWARQQAAIQAAQAVDDAVPEVPTDQVELADTHLCGEGCGCDTATIQAEATDSDEAADTELTDTVQGEGNSGGCGFSNGVQAEEITEDDTDNQS